MRPPFNKSITLLELLIALVIMGLLIVGFSSIDLFSRYHVIASERRAKLQNEVSFGLEHMTKSIGRAIGDINDPPVIVDYAVPRLDIWVDNNSNGMKDADDLQVVYVYDSGSQNLSYLPDALVPQDEHLISQRIHLFNVTYNATNNYIFITIGSCWDPAQTGGVLCGSPDNPAVIMNATIRMPSVSTN